VLESTHQIFDLTHNLMTRIIKQVITRCIKILQYLCVFSSCPSRLPLCYHFSAHSAVCCCLCYYNMESTHRMTFHIQHC